MDFAGRQRFADFLLDVGETDLRLLNTRARRRASMQAQGAAVNFRKEVLSDPAKQSEGANREDQKTQKNQRAVPQ